MVSERTSRLTLAAVLGVLNLYMLFGLGLVDKFPANPGDSVPYGLAQVIVGLLLAAQLAAGASKETQSWGLWTYLALGFGGTLPWLVTDAWESASSRWVLAATELLLVLLVLGYFRLPPDLRERLYGSSEPSSRTDGR